MRARRGTAASLCAGILGVVALAAPPPTSAHPLGNSTINHFDRVTVGSETIRVLHVVDMAEIPTVSERQQMDADDDGTVDAAEARAYLSSKVPALVESLELIVDGRAIELRTVAPARMTFPAGQAGLATLRIELDLIGNLPPNAVGDREIDVTFRDDADPERTGWREVVVVAGSGATVREASVGSTSASDALRAYPRDGLDEPIDVREATFRAELRPDAAIAPVEPAGSPYPTPPGDDPVATLLERARGGGPIAALLALLVSVGLGAAHAASPGHGKTLMAAYLVGSRGTPSQALALALTVAVTHTIGVFVLGIVVFVASDVLLPERVVDWLGLAAGVIVVAMGIRLTARLVRSRAGPRHEHGHPHPHAHPHPHPHDDHHDDGSPVDRLSGRSVALIGLAGGMVPSTSALIVLLVGLSQAQLALGIAMVVAFGVGMAIVLGGIGLVVVVGRRFLDERDVRLAAHPLVGRVASAVPAVSALTVLVIGIVLALGAAGRIA